MHNNVGVECTSGALRPLASARSCPDLRLHPPLKARTSVKALRTLGIVEAMPSSPDRRTAVEEEEIYATPDAPATVSATTTSVAPSDQVPTSVNGTAVPTEDYRDRRRWATFVCVTSMVVLVGVPSIFMATLVFHKLKKLEERVQLLEQAL